MATCPKLFECGLQRSVSVKEALRVWQSFYCEGCSARCERFKLLDAGLRVPVNLLPNGKLIGAAESAHALAAAPARRR